MAIKRRLMVTHIELEVELVYTLNNRTEEGTEFVEFEQSYDLMGIDPLDLLILLEELTHDTAH